MNDRQFCENIIESYIIYSQMKESIAGNIYDCNMDCIFQLFGLQTITQTFQYDCDGSEALYTIFHKDHTFEMFVKINRDGIEWEINDDND